MNYTQTLAGYRNKIKRKFHISLTADNGEWSNAYLNECINEARKIFWDKANYRAKKGEVDVSSVANTEGYDLSGQGITAIIKIRYNNGTNKIPLSFVSLQDYLALTETSQSGTPEVWTILKNTLKLYPKPATAVASGIEIFCEKTITELDDDTDIDTDIQDKYDYLIVRLAYANAWAEAEQENKANYHFAIFEKQFASVAFEVNSNTIGENIGGSGVVFINETDERHYSRPIG